jgi:hypothetical protein
MNLSEQRKENYFKNHIQRVKATVQLVPEVVILILFQNPNLLIKNELTILNQVHDAVQQPFQTVAFPLKTSDPTEAVKSVSRCKYRELPD